jgi:hypothetical protein
MVVSRCHRLPVMVSYANEGVQFYVCSVCHRPCDTMFLSEPHGEVHDDTRSTSEVERITCSA